MVIELLAGKMRLDRGGIAAVEDDMRQTYTVKHIRKGLTLLSYVVTAHDTNLMTRDLWRDDEVWFVEKRSDGSSNMYSLSQFSPKRDKNLSRGYLKGLYGALPCIGGHMV